MVSLPKKKIFVIRSMREMSNSEMKLMTIATRNAIADISSNLFLFRLGRGSNFSFSSTGFSETEMGIPLLKMLFFLISIRFRHLLQQGRFHDPDPPAFYLDDLFIFQLPDDPHKRFNGRANIACKVFPG